MIDLDKLIAEPTAVADVLTGQTTVTLGGTDYVIPARSIEGDEQWVAGLDSQFRGLLSAVEKGGNDTTAILATMLGFKSELLAALVSYAPDALPSVDEIRKSATAAEVLIAVAKVWRLANPLAALAMAGMARSRMNGTPSVPTTTSQPTSAGRSRKSARA